MENELVYEAKDQNIFLKTLDKLAGYMAFLNNMPKKIKKNELINKDFIPIGEIQRTLDEIYSGLWSETEFKYSVIANEIIGSITLEVFHPVAKVWIKRTGAAAVMIQTNKGTAPTVENKIKNTLIKDFPHLKSECLKNAAKSLGVVFGRNLNRDEVEEMVPLSEQIKIETEKKILISQLIDLMIATGSDAKKIEDKEKRAIKATSAQIETQIIKYKEIYKQQKNQ